MFLDVFQDAPTAVQIHVITALAALVIGPLALYRRNRDFWHP